MARCEETLSINYMFFTKQSNIEPQSWNQEVSEPQWKIVRRQLDIQEGEEMKECRPSLRRDQVYRDGFAKITLVSTFHESMKWGLFNDEPTHIYLLEAEGSNKEIRKEVAKIPIRPWKRWGIIWQSCLPHRFYYLAHWFFLLELLCEFTQYL